MTKYEAIQKGYGWTDFDDIPAPFKYMYDIILACNPLADATVRGTVTGIDMYNQCCEYWFNNQIIGILQSIKGDNGPKDPMEDIMP